MKFYQGVSGWLDWMIKVDWGEWELSERYECEQYLCECMLSGVILNKWFCVTDMSVSKEGGNTVGDPQMRRETKWETSAKLNRPEHSEHPECTGDKWEASGRQAWHHAVRESRKTSPETNIKSCGPSMHPFQKKPLTGKPVWGIKRAVPDRGQTWLPKLGKTRKELRGQSSEKDGHRHPSWNVENGRREIQKGRRWQPKLEDKCRETKGQRFEKPEHDYPSWETNVKNSEQRDPKRADITSQSGDTCKEWRAQRSRKEGHRDPNLGDKCKKCRVEGPQNGEHHYPSWETNVKNWKHSDPESGDVTTQAGRQMARIPSRDPTRADITTQAGGQK